MKRFLTIAALIAASIASTGCANMSDGDKTAVLVLSGIGGGMIGGAIAGALIDQANPPSPEELERRAAATKGMCDNTTKCKPPMYAEVP